MTITHKFGAAIRKIRGQQNLSQEQLAEVANLNRSYLGEIERGLVTPSLATIEKLATALKLTPSELISLCESPQTGSRSRAS